MIWIFEFPKMSFLLRTAITIFFLLTFDMQIRLFASTSEWFFIFQQFFEKLLLFAEFIETSFGKLEDFAKRDVVAGCLVGVLLEEKPERHTLMLVH